MKRYPVVRFIIVIMFLYLLYMIAHTKDFCTHVSKLHVKLYSAEIRNGKRKSILTSFIKIHLHARGYVVLWGYEFQREGYMTYLRAKLLKSNDAKLQGL